uniref:TM2 domain-containing protein n=1 Tax=Syphacia muris TaxID=451379 RepID=A0A0N5AXY1_9BILA
MKNCTQLLLGQYRCDEPKISITTQQPETCDKDNSVLVFCQVIPGIQCIGLNNATGKFQMRIANLCSYPSKYYYNTALVLSFFTGIFGGDRFYLGYYAIGFLKLFSCGGFLILWIFDVIMIALQRVGPADGSRYIMDYYGPVAVPTVFSNLTYVAKYTCFNCAENSDVVTSVSGEL